LAAFASVSFFTVIYVLLRLHPDTPRDDSLEESAMMPSRRTWNGHAERIYDYAMFLRSIFHILLW
jgi:hypothetical protein